MATEEVEGQQQKSSAIELVRLRNYFYRDNYRRLVSISFLLLIVLIILGALCFWLLTHRPPPRYFATNIQGGLMEIQPLSQPVLSNVDLTNWAVRAATSAFTVNYVQYRQQIEQTVDTYFTDQGGQQYQDALKTSNDLDYLQAGKFIVTAEPNGAPRILAQGVVPNGAYQGRYAWQVQIPLTVNSQNERGVQSSQLLVDLVIVRSSLTVDQSVTSIDAALGVGVAELVATTTTNKPAVAPGTSAT